MPAVSRVILLAGLPFSAELFAPVVARLGVVLPEVEVRAYGAGALETVQAEFQDAVVVAHGLAVPMALQIARGVEPLLVIASNGPISRLDNATRTIARLSSFPMVSSALAQLALLPIPWLAALRSSVALRRTVNNPYAMDRDTVAAICGPTVATRADRARLVAAYAALSRLALPQALPRCPVHALWGDNDRLYPTYELDLLTSMRMDVEVQLVPGGRFLHVIEQPWCFADAVAAAVRRVQATPGSPSGGGAPAPDAAVNPDALASMSRKPGSAKSESLRRSTTVSVVRS